MRLYVVRSGTVRGQGNYLVDEFLGHRLWCSVQAGARLFRRRKEAAEASDLLPGGARVVRLKAPPGEGAPR